MNQTPEEEYLQLVYQINCMVRVQEEQKMRVQVRINNNLSLFLLLLNLFLIFLKKGLFKLSIWRDSSFKEGNGRFKNFCEQSN